MRSSCPVPASVTFPVRVPETGLARRRVVNVPGDAGHRMAAGLAELTSQPGSTASRGGSAVASGPDSWLGPGVPMPGRPAPVAIGTSIAIVRMESPRPEGSPAAQPGPAAQRSARSIILRAIDEEGGLGLSGPRTERLPDGLLDELISDPFLVRPSGGGRAHRRPDHCDQRGLARRLRARRARSGPAPVRRRFPPARCRGGSRPGVRPGSRTSCWRPVFAASGRACGRPGAPWRSDEPAGPTPRSRRAPHPPRVLEETGKVERLPPPGASDAFRSHSPSGSRVMSVATDPVVALVYDDDAYVEAGGVRRA